MPATAPNLTPGLASFLKSLKTNAVESSIEQFIALLKRRQIRNSRPCAIATTQLLFRVVAEFRGRDVQQLMDRVRRVGQRLIAAQPREMAVGNMVRRVLSLIRVVVEEDSDAGGVSDTTPPQHHQPPHALPHRPALSSSVSTFSPLHHGATRPLDSSTLHQIEEDSESYDRVPDLFLRPPLLTSHTSYAAPSAPVVTSLFGLLSQPDTSSNTSTPPGYHSPVPPSLTPQNLAKLADTSKDIKAEVLDGVREILDELDQVDEQIAAYAVEHIHSNEIVLIHTASQTVQRFLLQAARKRQFTVVMVEGHPNGHAATYDSVLGRRPTDDDDADDDRLKPLTEAGITVILIPDSAVFAIMSRVNKVILATHTVLANGGLVAAAGARTIAKAAKMHQTPVVVLSGVYKLSPVYPFDVEELIEHGDPGKVVGFREGGLVQDVDVVNPLADYVQPELVDLYITNLGGHAPSYLYRIVADHYHVDDINL